MFWNLLLGVASFALQIALTPKPQDAKPAALGDFKAPTAEEGREIPVLFGTRLLEAPNVTWYGDLGLQAIKGARRYGFFGPKQTIGWKYFLGMQMVLCHGPADKCIKIRVSDKVAFEGTAAGGQITIHKSGLFGGDDREGGISGKLDLEMGEPTQDRNDYLAEELGDDVSAFRGVVTAVLRRMYIGNSPYLKPWSFKLQRIFKRSDGTDQWYPAKAAVPSVQIAEDEPGDQLASGLTMNEEGQVDTNGDYAAWSEGPTVRVWHLPDGAQETAAVAGQIQGGGRVHITDFGELVVLRGGNLFGSADLHLEFRDIADPDTVLESFNLGAWLNWGFEAAEYQGRLLIKLGPETFQDRPWFLFERGESGWSQSFTEPGVDYPGTSDHRVRALTLGPTYGYAKLGGNGDHVIRVRWNGVWAEDVIDLSAEIAGSVRAISYISGEVVILTATAIYVFNEDLSTLLRSRTGFSNIAEVQSSKRMTTGSGSILVAQSGASGSKVEQIYQIQLSSLATVATVEVEDSELVQRDENYNYLLYNLTHGTAYVAGHVTYIVFWPIFAIGEDMNPAHVIRECLTDRNWGMGYNADDIDEVSFTAAADTFYAEGFGLSLLWQREEQIGEFINMVLSHVDAYLYTSRQTGKYILKPIRADYDIDTIEVVEDGDDIIEWNDISQRQSPEAVSSVIGRYHDTSKDKDASLQVTDTGHVIQLDGIVTATRHYLGISNSTLAARVLERDVKSLSAGMASGLVTCKRTVGRMNPGDPFRLYAPRRGYTGEVFRVAGFTFGDGRKNAIGMKILQDVFHLGQDPMVVVPPPIWQNPSTEPQPIDPRLVHEMPYREMLQMVGATEAASLLATDADAGLLQVAGAQPSGDTIQAIISVDPGTGYADSAETLDFFAPHALLAGALGKGDTLANLTGTVDLADVVIGSLAIIGDEIVKVEAVAGTSVTLGRGCLDTVPASHLPGAAIIFFDDFSMTDFEIKSESDEIGVKLRPITGRGALELPFAPEDTVAFNSRAIRPYPPKGATVDDDPGYSSPVSVIGIDPFSAEWVRRNRLTEAVDAPLDWNDADQAPEAGQTTTVKLTDTGGAVIHSYTGIAGTSQAIAHADFAGEETGFVEFWSVRGGYESWQAARIGVILVDPDTAFFVTFTIPAATVGSDLTDFPVMVRLSDMPAGFWLHVKEDGGDIRVKTTAGALVPIDLARLDYFDQDGVLFFKAGLIDADADSEWEIHYGDGALELLPHDDANGRDEVWSAYDAVMLFGLDRLDRTGKGGIGTHATNSTVLGTIESLHQKIATSGDVDAHQGLCWGEDHYFIVDTNSIKKYDAAFGLVDTNADPIGDSAISGVDHCGDPEFHDGKIYVPMEVYPSDPYVDQHIAVFDAADLSFIESFDISAQGHEVSSIAYNPEDGLMYVTSFEDGTQLFTYDPANSFSYEGALAMSLTIPSIQGIVYWKGAFWITRDDAGASKFLYRVELDGTNSGNVFRQASSGGTGFNEGISKREDTLIVLYDGGSAEVVQTWKPRDIPLGAGGGLLVDQNITISYTGRPSRTTFTLGVSFAIDAIGSNRSALSYWDESAGTANTRVTLGYRTATPEFALWDPNNAWLSASPVPFNPTISDYHRAHAVYQGTTQREYFLDGVSQAVQAPITAAPNALDTLRLGSEDASDNERWDGKIGFVYLHPSALSADWIAAEYLNLSAPGTFYAIGPESGAVEIEGTPVLSGVVGAAYAGFTVSADGGETPYVFSIEDGALPSGLSLDPDTGAVAGTPDTAGVESGIVIRATDDVGNFADLAPFAITITETTISGTPVSPATEDVVYPGFTVSAIGGTAPYVFTVQAGTLPSGLSLDPDTGEVSGTPTTIETQTGIVIRATDDNGVFDDLGPFTIDIVSAGSGFSSGFSNGFG